MQYVSFKKKLQNLKFFLLTNIDNLIRKSIILYQPHYKNLTPFEGSI